MGYVNKQTTQTPKTGNSMKLVLAERVYIAPKDTVFADPTAKYNGADPASPWVDLGIVMGSKVSITYNKETAFVETGIDKVRRGAYLRGKNAQCKFSLEQFDIGVLEQITGLASKAVGSPVIGKKLQIGQEDVTENALLFVGTNKIDGKEHITYSKKAAITFGYAENDDARVLEVTADLYAFTPSGETVDALYTLIILD